MEKLLVDVNCFSINFVEDHPGYNYIAPVFEDGIRGIIKLVTLDVVPFRSYWILTKQWGCSKQESKEIIKDFLENHQNIDYIGLSRESIIDAFNFSETLQHDIYDCYYLSGALLAKCNAIMTTDTDYQKICMKLSEIHGKTLNYKNPVPIKILKEFSTYNI